MPTGEKSGMWVLDVDSYKPEGQQSLEWLIKNNGDLPKTCTSKTGGGGEQYFFKWPGNGTNIKNSTSVIAKSIDIRGSGGYIILPPSGHPSGGQYEWIKKDPPAEAPAWLIELAKEKPEPKVELYNGDSGAYGKKALSEEMMKLSSAGNGTRNNALNESAYALGQLVAGGELEHDHVMNSLLATAQTIGLKISEARKTIQSGLKGGAQHPRKAPEKDDIQYDLSIDNQQTKQTKQTKHTHTHKASLSNTKHCKASLSNTKHVSSEPETDENPINPENLENGTNNATHARAHAHTEDKEKNNYNTLPENGKPSDSIAKEPPHNLKAAIYQFIEDSQGTFTTKDIDTEFGLKTRKEKNARSWALNKAVSDGLIKKDKKAAGKYHIISVDIDWVDLEAEEPEAFPIQMPFNLHEYCNIPPGSIIILAGSSNAGKTALMLNAIRMNLQQNYKILYLMSEMGSGEFKSRIKSFKDPVSKWKKLQAASKSYDFESAIQHYNPNGLTCIDYLEEIDGEYFKIASNIRDIYDALGNGVAFIAIQKKADAEFARGGESTKEKARLYMTLDYLATQQHSIICALKITKNKHPLKKNLNYHEIHFRLTQGAQIEPITDWMPSSRVDRKKVAAQYELGRDDLGEKDYVFQTDKGQKVVIKEKDAAKWQEAFENIDVDWELSELSRESHKKPFVRYKGYYFQISKILEKRNNERG